MATQDFPCGADNLLPCAWLTGREAAINAFFLPGYSPELKPEEGINGDLKQTVRIPSASSSGTCAGGRFLRVRSFFRHRTLRYAT
jgi:hypothetical protein